MYAFGVTVLLGLALVTAINVIESLVPALKQYRVLTTIIAAVAGVIALDFSLFNEFGIALRNDTVGTWSTGFIVAGTTTMWRTAFSYFGTKEDNSGAAGSSVTSIAA